MAGRTSLAEGEEMTLPEMLAQIVELAQAKVDCPEAHYVVEGPPGFAARRYCPTCHGTGKVPDPRYAGLVEALTEECPSRYHHPSFDRWSREYYEAQSCEFCGGTGRVLRSWEDQPQGALNGALLQWASCLWKESIPASEELSLLVVSLSQCFGRSDCDDRATERVLEYVKKATHATE